MGSDYRWYRCRIPGGATRGDAEAVLGVAAGFLTARGYREEPAPGPEPSREVRGLVAHADGGWVQLGDSAGSTELQGAFQPPFEALAEPLSQRWALVQAAMSDDAVLLLEVWKRGRRAARYATQHLDWELLSRDELAGYSGRPSEWRDLAPGDLDEAGLAALFEHRPHEGQAGYRGRPAWEVLPRLGAMLGWHPELSTTGYSHDSEGLFIHWREYLEPEDLAGLPGLERGFRAPKEAGGEPA